MTRPPPRLIDSFLGLYDELARNLRRRTGDGARAEDAVQDTYLRLLDVESSQEIRDRRAFIYRVAGNLAIDAARRDQRGAGDGEPPPSIPDPSPGPEQRALAHERLQQLDRALRELPPNARLALLLFRVDGLSHAQIARRLAVSESMVAKYIGQAMRHCRNRLPAP
ncbi:sigma-70 family RNA polymerase sigma factor [Luteimonas sp. Y-2-2-4F]|nr:sigma-70 family RNA polymerase sigma factor [Luteimonas sp. Y-2-2-4F]MCD9030779.1 sigma-70 family RNA polymerase sigma factor [Luteimonas sp. Y-2-2-4F]